MFSVIIVPVSNILPLNSSGKIDFSYFVHIHSYRSQNYIFVKRSKVNLRSSFEQFGRPRIINALYRVYGSFFLGDKEEGFQRVLPNIGVAAILANGPKAIKHSFYSLQKAEV